MFIDIRTLSPYARMWPCSYIIFLPIKLYDMAIIVPHLQLRDSIPAACPLTLLNLKYSPWIILPFRPSTQYRTNLTESFIKKVGILFVLLGVSSEYGPAFSFTSLVNHSLNPLSYPDGYFLKTMNLRFWIPPLPWLTNSTAVWVLLHKK